MIGVIFDDTIHRQKMQEEAEAIAEIVDMPGEPVKEWLAETYEKNADN